ncbi:hypothetical protein J5N97_026503 [Dioscorea zingiberensis]|uniref:Uncharacterized protein n=1 Tax=Dioscorea zingiberensis TaxID=325984 RepID=A0A9D5C2W6_9LILI|nr:hypothetical protein J5N97_026503 [Dioscorea zingiberensis]
MLWWWLEGAYLRHGGFGSYLLGLNKKTYEQTGDTEGNAPGSYKEPEMGTGFLFTVSFVGLLALVPLRKMYMLFREEMRLFMCPL